MTKIRTSEFVHNKTTQKLIFLILKQILAYTTATNYVFDQIWL